MDADVVSIAPVDKAVIELVHDDTVPGRLEAVAAAWIQLDAREQAQWLKYHRPSSVMGAALRAALTVATGKYDLGVAQANMDDLKGRPWP